MAKLQVFCEGCGEIEFTIQRDPNNNEYDFICSTCAKHIASIGGYAINWIKEDNTDESSPTA